MFQVDINEEQDYRMHDQEGPMVVDVDDPVTPIDHTAYVYVAGAFGALLVFSGIVLSLL